jgi:hypothetical protein
VTGDPVDPIAVVHGLFPLDGPYYPDATRDAAAAAAECIRYLCRGTGNPRSGAIEFPVHVARTLSSLNALTHLMQQLLGQLAGQLGQFTDNPGLYDDHGADAKATVASCQRAMHRAAMGLKPVAALVSEAFEHANRLGIHTPPEEGQ